MLTQGAGPTRRDHPVAYELFSAGQSPQCLNDLEQSVWDECGFGDLGALGYTSHIQTARTAGAFRTGQCIGLARIFSDTGAGIPALSLPFFRERDHDEYSRLSSEGLVEEIGTAAVAPPWRGKGLAAQLWRLAYRDSAARRVRHWMIIMEPERVARMNRQYGFTFTQCGPATHYQGGNCATHVMDLRQASRRMAITRPWAWLWFAKFAVEYTSRSADESLSPSGTDLCSGQRIKQI